MPGCSSLIRPGTAHTSSSVCRPAVRSCSLAGRVRVADSRPVGRPFFKETWPSLGSQTFSGQCSMSPSRFQLSLAFMVGRGADVFRAIRSRSRRGLGRRRLQVRDHPVPLAGPRPKVAMAWRKGTGTRPCARTRSCHRARPTERVREALRTPWPNKQGQGGWLLDGP